ncbi:hypothetical protein H8E07_12720 [bacterium]|nr:hypothetical protein [bacterium]
MNFAFLDGWHRFLPRDGGHVVVVRGGGGRDDLIDAMRRVFAAEGVPVAVIAEPGDIEPCLVSRPDYLVLHAPAAGARRNLPRQASLLVTVTGLSDVGRVPGSSATGTATVPEAWLTPGDSGPVWSWDGVVAYLRDAAPTVPHAAALLEMEDCADSIGLFDCVGRIMSELEIPLILMGDVAGDEPRLRTAYALRPGASP